MTRRATRGQVVPLIAVCLATLMGFGGLAVDAGYWEYQQQAQQNATDAAAIGGAQQLTKTTCPSPSLAKSAAVADAASNGFSNGGNVVVTVQNPPQSGAFAGNSCAVAVQITTSGVSSFFTKLFGLANGVTESTQSVGLVTTAKSGGCIYLLSPNTWSSFNNATVSATGCAIDIDYTASFNGGTITSPYIGYAGGNPNMGGTAFPMASPAPMLPVTDPCPEIPGCAYIAANPPPATNCTTYNSNGHSGTIQPGCYNGLNLDGGTITFAPGPYVIAGNFNDNGAIITGSGVTIYVPAGANPPNFDNQSVSLSPPTSGNYAGVLYYQVPSNTASINFNGPNVNMSGLIYAPGSNSANFDGANGNYVVLVFGSANFNGNTAYDFASPPPGQSLIKQVVLAQ